FRYVNEDEEDVIGPITIMSEIKDAVQDEKLQVSNKNKCKSKKEMEPAATACAFMAALVAASHVVILDNLLDIWANVIFGVSIRPANNTVCYKGVWISVYVVLGIKSSTSLQLLSAAVLSYYFLQQINTASSRLTTVDRVTTTG
ncbi:hypothetical protein Tco_0304003, partial [Tanacetum coccineum]